MEGEGEMEAEMTAALQRSQQIFHGHLEEIEARAVAAETRVEELEAAGAHNQELIEVRRRIDWHPPTWAPRQLLRTWDGREPPTTYTVDTTAVTELYLPAHGALPGAHCAAQ